MGIDNLVAGFSLGLDASDPLLIAAKTALFSMAFAEFGLQLKARASGPSRKLAEAGIRLFLNALAAARAAGVI